MLRMIYQLLAESVKSCGLRGNVGYVGCVGCIGQNSFYVGQRFTWVASLKIFWWVQNFFCGSLRGSKDFVRVFLRGSTYLLGEIILLYYN